MAYSVYIDTVLVEIQKGSMSIEERIEERSTASFIVVDKLATADYVRGTPVEIYNDIPVLIFSGFIDTPGRARIAPNYGLYHDIVCMDNHYLADKRLVWKAYTTLGQTLADIVNDIWTDYLDDEGVIVGEIQTGPIIQIPAIINGVKVSEAFDALKELSGFIWFIDENKNLYFIDRATNAAPWNLDGVTHRAIKGSVYLSTGNALYRNGQYVRGGTGVSVLQTENFTADGVNLAFTVGYRIAEEPVITDSALGVQTVGIKGVETGFEYYWNKGDATVYAELLPVAGRNIEIKYYGQYPLMSYATDDGARLARQAIEGGTGIVEEIVTEAYHESAEGIQESARSKIAQYCREAERFTFATHDGGLAPGQLQKITYAPFGFTEHEMLIESISISAIGDLIMYSVTAITGPAMGSWARFFSRILKRQDNQIKIGDSQLLVLLQQSETLALTEATDYDSDDFSGGIVNRWIQLPPAQSEGHNVEHEVLAMVEAPTSASHATADYDWDDADMLWDFFAWA